MYVRSNVAKTILCYIFKTFCFFVFRAAGFGGFVNETEIVVNVSIEMFSMSSKSNEVTPF